MASNRGVFGPTPPTPEDPDHTKCPVCGWNPCTRTCRLALTQDDVLMLRALADWRDHFGGGCCGEGPE